MSVSDLRMLGFSFLVYFFFTVIAALLLYDFALFLVAYFRSLIRGDR
jgi:hypothetical protein